MSKLNDICVSVWGIHNVIQFMAEALPDDGREGLPIKSTLFMLQDMASKAATEISDLDDEQDFAKMKGNGNA